jgi:hypothetical protein
LLVNTLQLIKKALEDLRLLDGDLASWLFPWWFKENFALDVFQLSQMQLWLGLFQCYEWV